MHDDREDFGDDLIDVTGVTLRDLETISNVSLAEALRLIVDDDETGPVAGFTSRI
jgi:FXSXX-COOH protein